MNEATDKITGLHRTNQKEGKKKPMQPTHATMTNAIIELATAISGITGFIIATLTKYIDLFGTTGQVISWIFGVALMAVSIRYYLVNTKLKQKQMKDIDRNKKNGKDED